MVNPQYHLRLHPEKQKQTSLNTREKVVFTLQGPRDTPLHVTVVWSQGERIVE
jgi:calpain-7